MMLARSPGAVKGGPFDHTTIYNSKNTIVGFLELPFFIPSRTWRISVFVWQPFGPSYSGTRDPGTKPTQNLTCHV
eukprot:1443282-Rhodomonas_salina.1